MIYAVFDLSPLSVHKLQSFFYTYRCNAYTDSQLVSVGVTTSVLGQLLVTDLIATTDL